MFLNVTLLREINPIYLKLNYDELSAVAYLRVINLSRTTISSYCMFYPVQEIDHV